MSMTIERSFRFTVTDHGRKHMARPGATPPPTDTLPSAPQGRLPRITRLMALAIKFDGYLRDGLVQDYAELARLGHISRARMSQIMDLTLLAPDIQSAVLELPRTVKGRDPIRERHLRPITAEAEWERQREQWRRLR